MHKTYRRFHGYDYARGGSMFVTTCLEHQRPLFGRVDHERVVLSESGEIVKRELLAAAARFVGFITLRAWTVMPDHAHIRFMWPAGCAEAVKKIGAFVGCFKQMSHYHIAGRAPGIWEKGYTYLSTFFSPGERMVFKALAELEDVPMIRQEGSHAVDD